MNLSLEFKKKYKEILSADDYERFIESFNNTPVSAYRINPLKNTEVYLKTNQDQPIPVSAHGFYGKISGKSAEHVTGLLYSQEPAAQVVAQMANAKGNLKVLDLCAAPGGKSTQLLSDLNNEGLLVSNEISGKRSKVLVENIERFGARNVIVLNETSERLAQVFPEFFDLIVIDAPCSGEGMFRKTPDAMTYWTEDYPRTCAILQREILSQAMKMLSETGILIYSTCTWSLEENEENVRWLLQNYPTLELVNLPHSDGLSEGIEMPEAIRCWPFSYSGEGQFVAKVKNHGKNENVDTISSKPQKKNQKVAFNLSQEQMKLWQDFANKNLMFTYEKQNLQVFGENLYLLPTGLPPLKQLKIARNGLHLGQFKKNRFEPSFALGLALKPDEVKQSLEITSAQFKSYVSGATFSVSTDKKGWVQLLIKENGLGFAKIVDGVVKNYFPKGLRFHVD
ncbi:RNA methyltransferase [Lactococcus hircilactis]|uniref:RNA methyltransferase n=1 Tax=Lactococcus hircilactis TaxID=1494462 RepID=A0A7X1Z732_9LACT|nr:RsmB/NOP family class I SAM-dependent RNA methyltransferase [Lactococcus hircilactis]MQW38909.1 RNA methyltransferase [Lactococcus hircilactis]